MGGHAELEAFYRHLRSDDVERDALLVPHLARSRARAAEQKVVLAVADSTSYTFSGDADREGLGPVNKADQGFLAHVTLFVSADGTRLPLGIADVQAWTRSGRRSSVGKESARWLSGMRRVSKATSASVIHVADRESDIYPLMASMVREGERFVLRAAQDRRVLIAEDDLTLLFRAARSCPTLLEREVPLSARKHKASTKDRKAFPARRQRIAKLVFGAIAVELMRPRRAKKKDLQGTTKVNVVHVLEPNPPEGEPPVEWLLLTTEPVDTPEQIAFIVDCYRARWTIEEYFKATKTGCAFESKQLESFRTISNLYAYVLVVAYALILMRALSRSARDEPATIILSEDELTVLRAKRPKLPKNPAVREALLAVASLGGHLRNNGDPGWQTLSKGWAVLLALAEGYRLARGLEK